MDFWRNRRTVVTGGSGFLGSAVVARLRKRGAENVFVPRSAEYDLREVRAVILMLEDARPDFLYILQVSSAA